MRTIIRTVLEASPGLEATTRRPEKVARRGITLSPGRGARAIQRRPPELGTPTRESAGRRTHVAA